MQILISSCYENKNICTFQEVLSLKTMLLFFLIFFIAMVMFMLHFYYSFAYNNLTFLHMLLLLSKHNISAYLKRMSLAHTMYMTK